MKNHPLILTIDIGTTSTRAILFDESASALPNCDVQIANQLQTSADGGATFDFNSLFSTIVHVLDEVVARSRTQDGKIVAVAFDTFVSNVLGVSTDGEALTPVFTYADTRNAAAAESLRRQLGEDGLNDVHDRCGCPLHTSYLPARFRWLEEEHPGWLEAAAHWMSVGELLLWRLQGGRCVSYSVAAWTGLLNRRTLAWDSDWLNLLNLDAARLSPLVDITDTQTGLLEPWATRWPELADAQWLPAVGDGVAANIGSGCDQPDRIALTIGTTGAMRVVTAPAIGAVPKGLWLYRVSADRGLLGGATTEGGSLFAWLRNTLNLPDPAVLEAELAKRTPARGELTVLPTIGGERAPGWNENARAVFSGISLHTDPVAIVLASLEGIAYRFSTILQSIRPHLPVDDVEIIASGGGLLQSPVWLQIFADVLEQPVHALVERELTSRGLALLALETLGLIERPGSIPPRLDKVYHPRNEFRDAYNGAKTRQADLYQHLYG